MLFSTSYALFIDEDDCALLEELSNDEDEFFISEEEQDSSISGLTGEFLESLSPQDRKKT